MFSIFSCKHKNVGVKFMRVPRFGGEVLVEYSYCEKCKKQLSCKVSIVNSIKAIQAPVIKPVVVKEEIKESPKPLVVNPLVEQLKIAVLEKPEPLTPIEEKELLDLETDGVSDVIRVLPRETGRRRKKRKALSNEEN